MGLSGMIRHEAICQDSKIRCVAVLAEQVEIEAIVSFVEEHLGAIASLGDVVRNSLQYYARNSRHR